MNIYKLYFHISLILPMLSFIHLATEEENINCVLTFKRCNVINENDVSPPNLSTRNSDNKKIKSNLNVFYKNRSEKNALKGSDFYQNAPKTTPDKEVIQADKNPTDLESIFEKMIKKTNNYTSPNGVKYKVIPHNKITSFWQQVSDTLKMHSKTIQKQTTVLDTLRLKIESLDLTISKKDESIKSSQIQNSFIYVFGSPISKFVFKTLFFSIISILIIILIYIFYLYKNSHAVTKETVKDKNEIEALLSLEKQKRYDDVHKLKRELQTERNLVVELKEKMG